MAKKSVNKLDTASITNSEQKNPFVQESESNDTVDTFVPIGSLKIHIKDAVEHIYSDFTSNDLNKFLTMIMQIKNTSYGKITKFLVIKTARKETNEFNFPLLN